MLVERKVESVLVLGASGSVGRLIVERAASRGIGVTAQTRDKMRLAGIGSGIRAAEFDPSDQRAMEIALKGQDAVVFALGVRSLRTTMFSNVTHVLLEAMKATGVRRLVAITGAGAGDTKGHGGFLYDRVIYPLFTRHIYVDKDRQEALIEASGLDWVIVRPAPFSTKTDVTSLQALTRIDSDTLLRRITREEVAAFVLDQLTEDSYLHRKVFIGHP